MQGSRIGVPEHVLEERIGDEVVLLSLKRETFYSLNAAGLFLWQEVKSVGNKAHLVDALVERYGIDEAQAETDVSAFLQELAAKELISWSGGID